MAVRLITTIQRWEGMSTDEKPIPERDGSRFKELDTGDKYVYLAGEWLLDDSEPISAQQASELNDDIRRLLETQIIKLDSLTEILLK